MATSKMQRRKPRRASSELGYRQIATSPDFSVPATDITGTPQTVQVFGNGGYGGGVSNLWSIGGGIVTQSGSGLRAGITELWIDKTYHDITSPTFRGKFHVNDNFGEVFLPANLGKTGKSPTGSLPWIYCTGSHSQFRVNRATGSVLALSGALPSLDDPPDFPG